MEYKNELGSEDLNTFTICLRFNVKFLRPSVLHFLSYSTFIHANSLLSYLKHQSDDKLSFIICKYLGLRGVTGFCSKKTINSIRIQDQWHHVCWSVNTEGIESAQIKVFTILYFDGNEVKQGDAIQISVNSFFIRVRDSD